MIPFRVMTCLDESAAAYHVVQHRQDTTAKEAAADTRTPTWAFAKSVLVLADGRFVLVVLPASEMVDFAKLREALGAREVHLASESSMLKLFPDCELGAEPPMGNLYNLPVFVSDSIPRDEEITFNAGTHTEAIRMRYRDFERIVQPRVVDCAA